MAPGQALTFKLSTQEGESPSAILNVQNFETTAVGKNQVLIQILAAPINPLDIHVLRGQYPVKPRNQVGSEWIAGFDGVAKVIQCGSDVQELSVGNTVIPKGYGLGTWRTHAVVEVSDVIKITGSLDILFAAIIKTVVLPAYFLVEDMKIIEQGDWVIQNAGTSAISQMAAQFVRLKGGHTISIIRDYADSEIGKTVKQAVSGDSTIVEEESQVDAAGIKEGRKIVLALDSVWGDSARQLASTLSNGATFVNYGQFGGGGPTSSIPLTHADIFWRSITFRSFRSTAQAAVRTETEIDELLVWFADLFNAKQLRLPRLHLVKWDPEVDDVEVVLRKAVEDVHDQVANRGKTVFVFK